MCTVEREHTELQTLCGEPPFTGDHSLAVMRQHLYRTFHPLSERTPGVPAAFDTVICAALSRRPEDRLHTVTAFRDALRQYPTVHPALALAVEVAVASPRRTLLSQHRRLRQVISYTLVFGSIMLGIVLIAVLVQIAHGGHERHHALPPTPSHHPVARR